MAMTALQPLAVLFVLSSGLRLVLAIFRSPLKWAPAAPCSIWAREMQGNCPLVPPMATARLNR